MYFGLRKTFSTVSPIGRALINHTKPNRILSYSRPVYLTSRYMSSGKQGSSSNIKNDANGIVFVAAGAAVIGTTVFSMYKAGYFDTKPSPIPKLKETSATDERTAGIVALSSSSTKPLSNDDASQDQSSKAAAEPEVVLPEMPSEVPYLIIGAGTASFAACRAIRARDAEAKVLVIGAEEYLPYKRPPLSKELWFTPNKEDVQHLKFKSWSGRDVSVFYEDEAFYCSPRDLDSKEHGAIAVAKGKTVTKLDVVDKKAILSDGTEIKYEKCLLATGGKPRILPVLENASKDVRGRTTLFRNIDDFKKLDKITQQVDTVAVIGGGFLGSELACALGKRASERENKLKVYQTFPESGNMGMVLPEYLSKWSMEKVKKEGVNVLPGTMLVGCDYSAADNKVELTLNNGEKLLVDHVICAVGLEPNVELAKTSGLEVDSKRGGFLVNAELEARSNVWVAGDASCFYDTKLGRRRVEHHDHAVVSGRLAGENMTGAKKPYWHQSMFWSDLGPEVGYEAIGIVDSKLPTMAVFAKATEEDTPKAVEEKTGENLRSESAEKIVATQEMEGPKAPIDSEDYGKGIVFYLRDHHVVGMVMWNVFGKMPIARKVIKDQVHENDVAEVSKLFNLYGKSKEDTKS